MIYRAILKLRHNAYDSGKCKQYESKVPTICVGNLTVGGTGKTPHTELILKILRNSEEFGNKQLAVLSRGYRRKSKGFQNVPEGASAAVYGDEAVQIKNKLPFVTMAVDKNRVEGCDFLCNPELLGVSKKARLCADKNVPKADIIVLDDAFQYRKLKAKVNILLVDYNRPIDESSLLPFGNLRDLPERIASADIVIVTKCPSYLSDEERGEWHRRLGIKFTQRLFFTTISYCHPEPVFPEGDPRYSYSQKLVLFTGIANDKPLRSYLSDTYKIVKKFSFEDHHKFKASDISAIQSVVKKHPTAAVATTEKDAQRVRDLKEVPPLIKERLFLVPIEVGFLSMEEQIEFENTLLCAIK